MGTLQMPEHYDQFWDYGVVLTCLVAVILVLFPAASALYSTRTDRTWLRAPSNLPLFYKVYGILCHRLQDWGNTDVSKSGTDKVLRVHSIGAPLLSKAEDLHGALCPLHELSCPRLQRFRVKANILVDIYKS